MNEISKKILNKLLEKIEISPKKIGLYPGSFKPPHKGHIYMIEKILDENPDLEKLIIIISNKEKEGIGIGESYSLFNLYFKHINHEKILLKNTNGSPIDAMIKFANNNKDNKFIYFFGDLPDSNFNKLEVIPKLPTNIKPVEINIEYPYSSLKTRILREAIKTENIGLVNKFLPNFLNSKDKLIAYSLLGLKMEEDNIPGGLSDGKTVEDLAKKYNVNLEFAENKLEEGSQIEKEHTSDESIAREIALDHLFEDLFYYDKLKKIELNEGKQVGTIYHFTSLKNLISIIDLNSLLPSEAIKFYTPEEKKENPELNSPLKSKIVKAISFTRNKDFHKAEYRSIGGVDARIVIDGDKLSNKYRIEPFNYDKSKTKHQYRMDKNTHPEMDEREERIITDEPITDLGKYVISYDILVPLRMDIALTSYLGKLIEKIEENFLKDKTNVFFGNDKNPTTIDELKKELSINENVTLKPNDFEMLMAVIYDEFYEEDDKPKIIQYNTPEYYESSSSFGGYNPETKEIHLSIYKRTLADCLRTLFHELCHHTQNIKGNLKPNAGEDGDEFENEANAYAGKKLREIGRKYKEIYTLTP